MDADLLQLAQRFAEDLHRRKFNYQAAPLHSAQDILQAYWSYTRDAQKSGPPTLHLEWLRLPDRPTPFHQALRGRTAQGSWLILAKETTRPELTGDARSRLLHSIQAGFAPGDPASGVLLLQGIYGVETPIAGPHRLADADAIPVQILHLHLGANPIRTVRIVHAIIPLIDQREPGINRLLFTLSPDDECPRLPGGGIEVNETPEQAILRELTEELELHPHELQAVEPLLPHGLKEEAESPSSGRLTCYWIHPFLVKVHPAARAKILRKIQQPQRSDPCRIWPELWQDWLRTGLGFGTSYPQQVHQLIPAERLRSAAITYPG